MTGGLMRKTLTPIATALMQQAMSVTPRSLDDLVRVSGLSKPVVTRYVNALYEANMVYVAEWDRDARGYPTIRKYTIGKGPDVTCPKSTRTPAQRMRDLRASRKGGAA